MKILVTGGAGYIGSVIVDKLIERGDQVIVYDNLSSGFKEAVPAAAQFILGDVRDDQLLTRVLKDKKIEAVIHMAAKSIVKESTEVPLEYYDSNVNGTLQLLKSCEKAAIKYLVFSSTAAVYGNAQKSPVSESSALLPMSPYGSTKLMGEKIIQDYAATQNLYYIILRYFNVAGAMLNMKQGHRFSLATQLIKVASQVAIGQLAKTLEIFGTDYETQDGTAERDYIHVEDLADVHLLALDYLFKSNKSEILNCGYGAGYSVKNVIESFEKIIGHSLSKKVGPRRAGDPAQVYADSSRLQKVLNWKPKYQDLDQIVKSSLDWELQLKSKDKSK